MMMATIMMRHMVLALALLLVMLTATAHAVSCFECDSLNDLKCGDDFQPDDIPKTDCDAMELPEDNGVQYLQRPKTTCLIKYYGGSSADEINFVRRSCGFVELSECDYSPDPLLPDLSFLGCKSCDTDLCNGSSGNVLSQWSTLCIFPLLLLVLEFMRIA